MPRKPVWPPVIFRHKSGQARVRIRGTDHYLGEYGSARAAAAYADLLAKITSPDQSKVAPSGGGITVAGVVAFFLAHAEKNYSARGREAENHRLAVRPLTALFGLLPAGDFGPKHLKTVQQAMASGSWMDAAERKKAPVVGWCRNVVNRRVVRLRTLWKWAESEELVPRGSAASLATVRAVPKNAPGVRNTPRRAPTSWEDLQAVCLHCPAPVRVMLQLQWWTGMRSQDVRLFRGSRLDTSGDVWLYRPEIDKGDWRDDAEDAPRVVQLGPECQGLLISWCEQLHSVAGYLFPPSRVRVQATYTAFSYSQAVRRASAAAGVKVLPYGGRHAAKMRVTREMGADAARAYLGQRSIQSTAHYGDIDRRHAEDVAREMG